MRASTQIVSLSVLVLLGVAACDNNGTGVGPPSQLQDGTIVGTLVVGNTVQASVTVLDAQDREVKNESVTWTASGDGAVTPGSSTTDVDGIATTTWTLGTEAGTQTLVAEAGDVYTEYSVDVGAAALDTIVMTPAGDTLTSIGDTLEIAAAGADQYGNDTALPTLTWASSDPAVASVDAGVVIAHAQGTVDITASGGGVTGTTKVRVDQVVVGVAMDPASPVLLIGETVDMAATPVDARDVAVDTTVDFAWVSANTAVATVSDSGVVSAIAQGSTTISATHDTWVGQADVEVRSGTRPTITGITPTVLGAGDTATIRGTGFGTDAGAVGVTVGGLSVSVLSLADTVLTAALPPTGAFPCEPAGDREIIVSVDGLDASATHPVAGAERHTLAVGGSVALLGGEVACNELTEPGTYVISVFNSSTSPVISTAARLQGAASGEPAPLARSRIQLPPPDRMAEPDPELEGHLRMLERNRRLVQELGSPRPGPARPDDTPLAAETVGDIRTFRIPDLDAGDLCATYIDVTARAVYSGTYGVIWEDTLAPLAGTMDATWDTVGTEYDTVMHQILVDYFGDPLAYDAQLDNNGLFYMLFSETVNNYSTTAVNGFVFSGDFYTRSLCEASDHGEIFYGRVPTVADTDGFRYDAGEIGDWEWRTRSTVIHEVKHLTSYANKFDANASVLEETGLEEATARLAEEFFARTVEGFGQGDNVGYQESLFCERRPTGASGCPTGWPLIMGKHYGGVNDYLKTPALLSPFGRVESSDNSFYGSGWQWVRWAIDQSGLPEADVIKPLIREPTLTGPANLADKVGDRSVAELLADYTLAFATDDAPGFIPARTALTMPSWDTRDIFQGLHDDYAGTSLADTYPTAWPLEPIALTGGSFQVDVNEIHGGAAAIFQLDGMAAAQLLELLSTAGGTAPGSLGLSIVRIQ